MVDVEAQTPTAAAAHAAPAIFKNVNLPVALKVCTALFVFVHF